jgi:hypothetical protein
VGAQGFSPAKKTQTQGALARGVCFHQTVNLKAKQNQSFTEFIAEIPSKTACQVPK